MHSRIALSALSAAAIALLAPSQAHAADIVNTPVTSGGLTQAYTLDGSNWVAQSFSLDANTQITSVMAYLLSNAGGSDTGTQFSVAIYANEMGNVSRPALNFNLDNHGALFVQDATYKGDGWNGLSQLQWSLGAGSYWLALEVSPDSSNAPTGLLAPTGALLATGVASYTDGQHYAVTSPSESFGLRITGAAPAVPEPNALALMLAGMGVVGWLRKRT